MHDNGENVRIRMSSGKLSGEIEPLVASPENINKNKRTKWGVATIAICAVVGIAIVSTVLLVRNVGGAEETGDQGRLKIMGQDLLQDDQQDLNLDRNRVATDPEYRLLFVKQLLDKVPLIDGHNDLPMLLRLQVDTDLNKVDLNSDLTKVFPISHTDIPRIKQGKLGGQFWSVYVTCRTQYKDAVQRAFEQIDLIKLMVLRYPETFELVTSSQGILDAHARGKFASLIGIEGGHMIGESMGVLRQAYELGARYLTLTHTCNTPWGDTCSEDTTTPSNGGLTDWGKLVVKEMNRLGMLVDLSHVSPKVMADALDTSVAPIIFSHSSAKALCPNPRNVPDDILKRVKDNGGIVMVNFNPPFVNCTADDLTAKTATLEQVADHVDYVRDVAGEDHVGIGADFDGITSTPVGLEDVSKYPYLFAELLRRGWTPQQLKKLAGLNIIRVFSRVEEVKASMSQMLPDGTPITYNTPPPSECKTSVTTAIKYP